MFEELAQYLLIISVGTNSGQNIGPVSSTRHVSPARTGENKNLTRLLTLAFWHDIEEFLTQFSSIWSSFDGV